MSKKSKYKTVTRFSTLDDCGEANISGWYEFAKTKCSNSWDFSDFLDTLKTMEIFDTRITPHKKSLISLARRSAIKGLMHENKRLKQEYVEELREYRKEGDRLNQKNLETIGNEYRSNCEDIKELIEEVPGSKEKFRTIYNAANKYETKTK